MRLLSYTQSHWFFWLFSWGREGVRGHHRFIELSWRVNKKLLSWETSWKTNFFVPPKFLVPCLWEWTGRNASRAKWRSSLGTSHLGCWWRDQSFLEAQRMVGSCWFKGSRDRGPACFSYPCSHSVWVFYHGVEHFLWPSGFSGYSDSAWCWHISPLDIWHFRSLLYYYDCLFYTASWSLAFLPYVALSLGSRCTDMHCTVPLKWLFVPVWVTTSSHTSNMLPQFFSLESFSFSYFVRSLWFLSCFDLKQKYFTRLRVSHFPCLPPLLHLKVPEISWGTWAEEYVYPC